MERERDSIEEILRSIADAAPVNWDDAVRNADSMEKRRVEDLHDVARIAEFHRNLARRAGSEGGSDPVETIPEKWGELLVLERIGSGSGAEVFRAWDPLLQRDVALKVLRPREGAHGPSGIDSSALLQEGRALARVQHPHVVAVHGIDVREGRVGLWMELVRGVTLEREVQAHGALAPHDVARLGVEIGSALAAVHAGGLVHRDVKPANVVRDAQGRFVLADFGLGIRWDEPSLETARPTGTPLYMAPELFAGSTPGPRTDVYSLGLLLWYALAARHAFDADSFAGLRSMASRGTKPDLRTLNAGVDGPLAEIIERAAAPSPEARLTSASELVGRLRDWMRRAPLANVSRPSTLRPGLMLAGVAGIASIAALLVLGPWRKQPSEPSSSAQRASLATEPAAPGTIEDAYSVEASFLLRQANAVTRLVSGDRVSPGDRLSLELRVSRPTWAYVLNEDDRGECYLLFPQPMFDLRNPISADTACVLPGPIAGKENAWTVTSRGGREHFLIVVSPEPVEELEKDLAHIAAPEPGKPIEYAPVPVSSVERLRGVGGIEELPRDAAPAPPRSGTFQRFRALAGREEDVRGLWVRHVVLENPVE